MNSCLPFLSLHYFDEPGSFLFHTTCSSLPYTHSLHFHIVAIHSHHMSTSGYTTAPSRHKQRLPRFLLQSQVAEYIMAIIQSWRDFQQIARTILPFAASILLVASILQLATRTSTPARAISPSSSSRDDSLLALNQSQVQDLPNAINHNQEGLTQFDQEASVYSTAW